MAVNPDKNAVEQGLIARLIGKIKRIALDIGDSVAAETSRAQAAEAAAKTEVVQGENCSVTKTTASDGHDVYTVNADGKPQVQSDWNQADSSKVDYIKNKPTNLVQDANYVHTDNNFTDAEKTKLGGIESGAQVNVIEKVKVNGTEQGVTEKAIDISVPTASTATPLNDGTASAGSSTQWSRGDHVHPTDTSREAVSNKAQVVVDSSTTAYPSSKAVADFVNSSIATNTANFLGSYDVVSDLGLSTSATNAQIATALGSYQFSTPPTNNDYVFVSINLSATTDVDEYRRFKFNGTAWAYEYTLNNSSFTATQWAAINSGLSSSDKTTYDAAVGTLNAHVADSTIHVTSTDKTTWNGKQDAISTDTDSSTISDATTIATGYGSNKVHLNTAARLWAYIQDKISSVLGLTASSYGGNAATASTASYANEAASGSALETALNSKAADADVVHKSGNETITNIKTFLDESSPRHLSAYSQFKQSKILHATNIKSYNNWTTEEKDGNHYRQWSINITPMTRAQSSAIIRVRLKTSYANEFGAGILDKVIAYQIYNNAVATVRSDYTLAQSPCSSAFRISDIIKVSDDFYIRIINNSPASNNFPELIDIDVFNSAPENLSLVSLTGEIVEGWPTWAGDINTPVQVTANGSPVYSKPSGGIPSTDLSSGVQTSLGKADSSVQYANLNGETITPTNGTLGLGFHPTARQGAASTVASLIQELRVIPGGSVGSVSLVSSEIDGYTIPQGWYSYIWIPHRDGSQSADNQSYGKLILLTMVPSAVPQLFCISAGTLGTTPTYKVAKFVKGADGATGNASTPVYIDSNCEVKECSPIPTDSNLVHKSGAETITGIKTFSGNYGPVLTNDAFMWQTALLPCSAILPYNSWSAAQKDGNHYRQWEIDITNIVDSYSTHACVQVTLKSSWSAQIGHGLLKKSISFQTHQQAVVTNVGDYVEAYGNAAQWFRISDIIKYDNKYVIRIVNSLSESNNYPIMLKVDYLKTSNGTQPTLTQSIVEGWPTWAGTAGARQRITCNGTNVMLAGDAAASLNASAGGTSQPVYFPASGADFGKPVAIPFSTDSEIAAVGDFLTIQAQGAYYAHKAGTAATADAAEEANTANLANRARALNIDSMGSDTYYVVVFDADGHPFKESDGTLGRLLFDASQKLLNTNITGNATSANNATSADSATIAAKLNASAGSDSQPVYFPGTGNDAGKPVAIPLVQHSGNNYLQMQTEGAYYAQTAGTATSAVSATKDGLNREINTTYCTQQYADPLLRLVNARPISNQTYALQGTSTWTHAFAFNFANYGDMPRGRQSLILVCLQYECASGTALQIRMTYTGNDLLVEALPDGRHYVTLPVIWTMEHSSLTEPFDMYFSGNGNIRAMSGTLILM